MAHAMEPERGRGASESFHSASRGSAAKCAKPPTTVATGDLTGDQARKRATLSGPKSLNLLVGAAGFELATPCTPCLNTAFSVRVRVSGVVDLLGNLDYRRKRHETD